MNTSETMGANCNQTLSEAPLGRGKGCIGFWSRSDQSSGFHGNQYGYNGKILVSTPSASFLTGSSSFLQVRRTTIKSRMSSKFGPIRPRYAELAVLECLKKKIP